VEQKGMDRRTKGEEGRKWAWQVKNHYFSFKPLKGDISLVYVHKREIMALDKTTILSTRLVLGESESDVVFALGSKINKMVIKV